jgi:hypothetical protein
MRHWIRNAALALTLALVLPACMDLDTVNLNNPDAERALSDASDVESLLGGTFRTWHFSPYGTDPGMTLSVGAEEATSGWGNWTMSGISRFPRAQWTNNLGTSGVQGSTWNRHYGSLSAVNDAMWALQDGLQFGSGGANNKRVEAFGRFMQGMNHAWIALFFDQGYILDERIDLEEDPIELRPYPEVFDAAIGYFEDAIQVAQANSFSIPTGWFNFVGGSVSNTDLIRLAHTMQALYKPAVARTPEERAAVNWSQVLNHLDQGISGDLYFNGNQPDGWWHRQLYYQAQQIWARVDYMVIGPTDTSGNWEWWYNNGEWGDREEFQIRTSDPRIHAPGNPSAPGTDFFEHGSSNFHAGSPDYRDSRYLPNRYDHWLNRNTPYPMITERELRFLRAEALLRTGQPAAAAELINVTRVNRGGWEPLTGNEPNLLEYLIFEKRIENYGVNGPRAFFDARGWGLLWEGTPHQFPVPGADLELLGMDAYTFGGDQEGAPPRTVVPRAY